MKAGPRKLRQGHRQMYSAMASTTTIGTFTRWKCASLIFKSEATLNIDMLFTLPQLHTFQPSFRCPAIGRTSSDGSCGCLQISAELKKSDRQTLEVYSRQQAHHTNCYIYIIYNIYNMCIYIYSNIYISIERATHDTRPSSTHSSIVGGCGPTHSRPTSSSSSPCRSRHHGTQPEMVVP